MRMDGEQIIAVERKEVWRALNDPDTLARCIPGCQSIARTNENAFDAIAEVKIGPIGARFKGSVQLSELDEPNSCTIIGTGNGGIAGAVKGEARVVLADAGGGRTRITYSVSADVGGRMAQLGGPIIDATARNMSANFFAQLDKVLSKEQVRQEVDDPANRTVSQTGKISGTELGSKRETTSLWGWIAALVMAVAAGFLLGTAGLHMAFAVTLALLVVTAAAAYEAGRKRAVP